MAASSSETPAKHVHNSIKVVLKTALLVMGAKTLLGFLLSKKVSTKLASNSGNTRFSLSIAGIRGTYHLLQPILSKMFPKYGSGVTAALASLWIMVDGDEQRRVAIALGLLIKAALFSLRAYIYLPVTKPTKDAKDTSLEKVHIGVDHPVWQFKSPVFNRIVRIIHRHGELIQWHINAFHICLTAFNFPHLLPRPYYLALLAMTGYAVSLANPRKSTVLT
jgi:hypothetical protein